MKLIVGGRLGDVDAWEMAGRGVGASDGAGVFLGRFFAGVF